MSIVPCTVRLEDLASRDWTDLRPLVELAVGPGDIGRVDDLLSVAAEGGVCFVTEASDKVVGLLLLTGTGPAFTIDAIGVRANRRVGGVGRQLLRAAIEQTEALSITAETDSDSVGFYRQTGFTVTSLAERHPGVQQFRCKWSRSENV